MPSKGVAPAAKKKSNSKFCPEKHTLQQQNPQAGMDLQLAPTRSKLLAACGKIDSVAPESTKKIILCRTKKKLLVAHLCNFHIILLTNIKVL